MSPPGRPKSEYRRAQPEGTPISPSGHAKGEYRKAQPEGTPIRPPRRRDPVWRRLLPAPLLSLVLLIIWPVLNQSWSAGQMLLGAWLALAIPWFTEALRADKPVLRRPGVALHLGLVVLADIVSSNIEVARLILGREAAIRPGYVWLPLTITDPHGIVALAGIVTMTPGTLSADLSPDRRHLLIHAFNVDDPAALIATIKARYEAPLVAIFQ